MTGLLACTSWHASLSCNWRHISLWTKAFCLEIYFSLYFSCTFNLLFRNSSFHGFFFFFWKKKFMVWEKVWCGLGVAKSVLALQVFMGWNNHILLYWKPFRFLSKNSEALEPSMFAGSGVWISAKLLVCTASKQKGARFWGAPSAREVIWPKGACHHIYFLPRQTGVLEKGKIRMRPRKKSHAARGCLVSPFSPSSGQQCFALLVQIQAWSQFLCSRWQKKCRQF